LNIDFIKAHKEEFQESLKNIPNLESMPIDPYKIADECIKSKTAFAIDVLYYSEEGFNDWKTPAYINQ
jgi:hypothetical protein